MKRLFLGAAAAGLLLTSALAGGTAASAAQKCPGGFYLHNTISPESPGFYNPSLWTYFGTKDANGNGYLCVRGNGPTSYLGDPNAIVVVDDK